MIYLHARSQYSPLAGLLSLEELITSAQQNGSTALALTDVNGVYGIPHFVSLCRDSKLRPIIGAEIHIPQFGNFTLLCRSQKGWQALLQLISWRHRPKQHFGPATWKELRQLLCPFLGSEHGAHLFLYTCERHVLEFFNQDTAGQSTHKDNWERGLFFALIPELSMHEANINWAQNLGFPLLAINPIHMKDKASSKSYHLLRAIYHQASLEKDEVLEELEKQHREHFYPASQNQMKAWFKTCPTALTNSERLGLLCKSDWFRPALVFPQWRDRGPHEASTILRQRCLERLAWRYPSAIPVQTMPRLEHELSVIIHKGFASYFLVVADIVNRSPINCGRGSAAASLVSYLLGITHVDPIAHDLFFDRFLNREREDPPDIDVDFPWDEREQLFNEIFSTYQGRIAMVANHNFLQPTSALREVAKVLGISEQEINYVSKRLPHIPQDGRWQQAVSMAMPLVGCLRHISLHCGGVVITPGPITDYAAIQYTPRGLPVIQWEKDQTEMMGLIKIDLLGNRSLAVIRDAIRMANQNSGANMDYQTLDPFDHEQQGAEGATAETLIAGKTMGVFYIESPGTRLFLQKLQSASFAHNVVAGSIIRPAANRHANEFVRRLRGGRFRYLHPLLEPILKETLGILVYQEHVAKVAMALADFTSHEGNELRKVLGKKHKEKKLADYRQRFFHKAREKGMDENSLHQLWDMILSFAGYSFCKAHSASYCLVSFKACYLKTHFPAEFFAAVISNQGGFYSTEAYLEEARRLGINVLPPDINISIMEASAGRQPKPWIRLGLMHLHHLKQQSLHAILEERKHHGPFQTMTDLLERCPHISLVMAKALVKTRALAGLSPQSASNAKYLAQMWEVILFFAKKNGALKNTHELERTLPSPHVICERDYAPEQLLAWEQHFYKGHLTFSSTLLFQKIYAQWNSLEPKPSTPLIFASDIHHWQKKVISIAGTFVTMKRVKSKNNESMAFVSFADASALFETVFFPEAYARFRDLLFYREYYVVTGEVHNEMGALSLIVKHLALIPAQTNPDSKALLQQRYHAGKNVGHLKDEVYDSNVLHGIDSMARNKLIEVTDFQTDLAKGKFTS